MIKGAIEKIKKEMPEGVKLIAVTKTRTPDEMKVVSSLGIVDFGENRVQELEGKYDAFENNINWHLIGHLQRNKVKYIIDKVKLIHSVDSLRLAKTINQEAGKKDLVMEILLQVNIADEDTKFGLDPGQVEALLREIALWKHIKVVGLMAMAPYTTEPEENRKYFRALKKLSVDINSQKIDNICIKELSMGMTNDYKIAIEEGATMIRIGTGIFGDRNL